VDLKTVNANGAAREAALANNTGTALRTFRLAMAATGEFTQRKGGGNVTNAYNALVAYVNRMNAVYRAELSVAFTLVTGENIVYPNPNTDPYNNADQSAMLTENQQNLDKVIGSDKYDVGHVLGATGGSGGGIAAAESVCKAETKGQGVSGVGDGSFAAVFDDQLISHEVGHQFGMSHTFNSSIPVCTTREAKTSVEPGSGTTIMSYGYTCSDKTGNDDYEPTYQPFLNFHTVSYEQAVNYINTQSCYSSSALTNAVPVINKFPSNTTIPKSTPFTLSGSATDANAGDNLSYSWEGTNIGVIVPDPSVFLNTAQPPFFRSYPPVSTGTRTYPRLEAILNGSNNARGDKLPSVSIATTHRMTVRDNAGGLTYQTVTVTIDGNAGPFLETTNLSGRYQGS
ncbi:reprolysin-like metallopeptidase, partial [Arsenicibacter rosenii]|uniref:reprolysin-like metallopeptidase n=1 Tax=Arsenicibacter rosenii TaxID=1750698 RepID=UPI000AC64372